MVAVVAASGVIELRVPAALAYRHLALRIVSGACRRATEDQPDEDDEVFESAVISAFGEAFNNIALHAFSGRAPGIVQIEIRWDDEALVITLVDDGSTFDPTLVAPPALDALPEHGMGIFIMKSCMDEVVYRAGPPNSLRLVKRRRLQRSSCPQSSLRRPSSVSPSSRSSTSLVDG
jgi:serine/threonine-protein kinase RsbW